MFYKITNGSVMRGAETVLERVDFEIRDREKIAVVGRNGCGKTTLFKAILGEVEMEQGTGEEPFSVTHAGEPIIGYMQQNDIQDNSVLMIDEIYSVFAHLTKMERQMEALEEKMATEATEADVQAYTELHDAYDRQDGYTYKKEIEVMIKKFGFSEEDKKKPLSEFSGGQRTKISFIKLLLSKPDILLLDEPTNHLDIETIRWLEEYLQHYRSAVVVVSHDRMFLDRIVSVVYEIEYGETTKYTGNYAQFEKLKRERYEKQCKDYEAQQAEIARLNRLIERFRYKATKAAMAQSKLKQIERMVKINAPSRYDLQTFHADFQPEEDSVKKVLDVSKLEIGYGEPLGCVSFELLRGQKLGIVGKNGIGKSTLLKTLVGIVPPLSGAYDFGVRTKIGYFDQQIAMRSTSDTVLDDFCAEFPHMLVPDARKALGAFQFTGDDVFKTVDSLSGGEKVRLALCKILKRRPNVLILDEPTNHMDIVGKETLENMLQAYEGTILCVSHDRYFIRKIADRLLVFDESQITFHPYGYEEYEEKLRENPVEAELPSKPIVKQSSKKSFTTPLKEKNRIQKQLERLEKEINQYEEEIARLNAESALPEVISDYERLTSIGNQLSEAEQSLEAAMDEWTLLQDQWENICKTV